MRLLLLTLTLSLILASCGETPSTEPQNYSKEDVVNAVFNEDNLTSQSFSFNNSDDYDFEGKNGTKIKIKKGTFVDANGNTIEGEINIELKEALDPLSMVMSNLTTTSNGRALETGGMIYLNASHDGEDVKIASNKSISVDIPTSVRTEGMSFFKGKKKADGSIDWVEPEEIAKPKKKKKKRKIVNERSHNLRYNIGLNGVIIKRYPAEIDDEVSRLAWSGKGLKIQADTIIPYMGHTIHFYKQEDLTVDRQEREVVEGENTFIEDNNIGYMFEMKELGWANIDRLLNDPRTEEIDLFVGVSNDDDFDYVYATLVTQKMYLPGYQKEDGSYSFTHGDSESTRLPVGETATIITTALKDDQTYFSSKTIRIKKEQKLNLNLVKRSKKEIESVLDRALSAGV